MKKKDRSSNGQAFHPEDTVHEAQERQKRRKYLIVSGLPEPTTESPDERTEKDKETIESIAEELGVDDVDPECVSRIGRMDPSKPRLLRFKCSGMESKMDLLRNSRKLRDCPKFQKVFVNPDLTAMQRKLNASLRAELKARRDAGEKVMIRRGRVVNASTEQVFH